MNWKHKKVIELVALHGVLPHIAYKRIYPNAGKRWAKEASARLLATAEALKYHQQLTVAIAEKMGENIAERETENISWNRKNAFTELEEMRAKLIENKQYFQAAKVTKEKYDVLGVRELENKKNGYLNENEILEIRKEILEALYSFDASYNNEKNSSTTKKDD